MPFRYSLRQAGSEHPIGYSLAMLAVGMIATMMAAVTISIQASDRALRQSELRQCESVASDVRTYLASSKLTEAGQNQLRAKQELLRIWGCPQSSKG